MTAQHQSDKSHKQSTDYCTENVVSYNTCEPSYANKDNAGNVGESVNTEEDVFIYSREYLKQNTKIRGWLILFLCAILLGGFISLFTLPYLGLMLFGLACYTVYSFRERQPNAVFLARAYLVVRFIFDIILAIWVFWWSDFEGKDLRASRQLISSFLWIAIWFSYLANSAVVEEVIPIEYRSVKHLDYYIVAAIILTTFFSTFGRLF